MDGQIDLSSLGLSDAELFAPAQMDASASEHIAAPQYSYWNSVFRAFFRKKRSWILLILLLILLLALVLLVLSVLLVYSIAALLVFLLALPVLLFLGVLRVLSLLTILIFVLRLCVLLDRLLVLRVMRVITAVPTVAAFMTTTFSTTALRVAVCVVWI